MSHRGSAILSGLACILIVLLFFPAAHAQERAAAQGQRPSTDLTNALLEAVDRVADAQRQLQT